MSIKKQYLKSKPECKVTFKAQKQLVKDAQKVFISGDFNNWEAQELEMKKMKSGECSISLNLPVGQEYQYKFVIDGDRWESDTEADKLVENEFSGLNSVVIV